MSKRQNEPLQRLLYSPQEAAAMLGISTKTLSKLVRAGKIKYIFIAHRIKYALTDIEEFINSNRHQLCAKTRRQPEVLNFQSQCPSFTEIREQREREKKSRKNGRASI